MGLIKCPECGKKISDQVTACIHCGYPIDVKKDQCDRILAEYKENQTIPDNNPIALEITQEKLVVENVGKNSLKKRKAILFWAGLAVLLIIASLSFYFFYYRPHYVPQAVDNAAFTIKLNNVEYPGFFTGTMKNRKPIGTGHYEFKSGETEVTFEGEVSENNIMLSGNVTNLPVTIETISGPYAALYTGRIENSEIVDPILVSEMPYSIDFDGKKYDGLYSGQIKENEPNGTGTFQHENKEKYFEYIGSWENGKLKGEGELNSNDIIVHLPEVNRKGTYSGGVVDGIFCGQGKFSATTDDGVDYTYEGEWKNGLWDGQGKQVYDADDYANHIGTFKKGNFVPTVLEFFTSAGTSKNESYSMTKKSQEFIKAHEKFFTMNAGESILEYIDKNFTYAAFSKNPSRYGDKLFKITNLSIFQVFEYDDYWGRKVTYFLARDGGYNIYKGYFLNFSEKIVEGKRVTLYALPLDYATYKGVDGSDYWALCFAAVYVE